MSAQTDPMMFIPGPTEVFAEIREAMARPVISHRGPEIAEITRRVHSRLQDLFQTKNPAWFAASAATGMMEGAIRNLVGERVLCTVCGAFSDRQATVARKCGKTVDVLEFEPGRPVDPDAVADALAKRRYDVVTAVHSETSTGILNPIAAIGEAVHAYEDTLFVVDCVSSLGGAPVLVDDWGIDVAFAGVQKCLALPPGLCVFTVSPRAMERASGIEDRGHYFDFHVYAKMAERGQSPATTSIPHVFALDAQLQRIEDETLSARWRRHAEMARIVRERVGRVFEMFVAPEDASPTLSVFSNDRGADVPAMIAAMKKRGKLFGNGYGPLKDRTFRIGHMGDLTPDHVSRFCDLFDDMLGEFRFADGGASA